MVGHVGDLGALSAKRHVFVHAWDHLCELLALAQAERVLVVEKVGLVQPSPQIFVVFECRVSGAKPLPLNVSAELRVVVRAEDLSSKVAQNSLAFLYYSPAHRACIPLSSLLQIECLVLVGPDSLPVFCGEAALLEATVVLGQQSAIAFSAFLDRTVAQ